MGRENKLTAEQRQQIIDLFKAGEPPVHIGDKVGRSRHTVYNVLEEAGLHEKRQRTPMNDEDRARIIELAKKKTPLAEITRQTGRANDSIRKVLELAGIEKYWKSGGKKGGGGKRVQTVTERHPFQPKSTRTLSTYGGFTSVNTGTHYYITKGLEGRYYLVNDSAANHGFMSAKGYTSTTKARETLEYLKALIEREGGRCVTDVQNG